MTLIHFLMFLGWYHICYNFCSDQLKNDTCKSKQRHTAELCKWLASQIRRMPLVLFVTVAVTLRPIRSSSQAGALQPQQAGGGIWLNLLYKTRSSVTSACARGSVPCVELGSPWCQAGWALKAAQVPVTPLCVPSGCGLALPDPLLSWQWNPKWWF